MSFLIGKCIRNLSDVGDVAQLVLPSVSVGWVELSRWSYHKGFKAWPHQKYLIVI